MKVIETMDQVIQKRWLFFFQKKNQTDLKKKPKDKLILNKNRNIVLGNYNCALMEKKIETGAF